MYLPFFYACHAPLRTSVHLVRHLGFGPSTWRLKRAFGTSEDWVGSCPQEPIWGAFHLFGKTGRSGGKSNGTGLSTGNFSEKRNTFRGIPLFPPERPVFPNKWKAPLVSPPVFNPLWIPYPPLLRTQHGDTQVILTPTGFAIFITTVSDQTVCYCINCAFCRDVLYHSRMLKDVRADCFCASLQPTKFPCYVMHQARALSSKVNNTWL